MPYVAAGVALNGGKSLPSDGESTQRNPLDVRWEAAHNLVLALRSSGADHLAAVIMRQYLTI